MPHDPHGYSTKTRAATSSALLCDASGSVGAEVNRTRSVPPSAPVLGVSELAGLRVPQAVSPALPMYPGLARHSTSASGQRTQVRRGTAQQRIVTGERLGEHTTPRRHGPLSETTAIGAVRSSSPVAFVDQVELAAITAQILQSQ